MNKMFWLKPIWIYFFPPAKAGGNSKWGNSRLEAIQRLKYKAGIASHRWSLKSIIIVLADHTH